MTDKNKTELDDKRLQLTDDGKVIIDDPQLFAALSESQAEGTLDEEGLTSDSSTVNIYKCGVSAL